MSQIQEICLLSPDKEDSGQSWEEVFEAYSMKVTVTGLEGDFLEALSQSVGSTSPFRCAVIDDRKSFLDVEAIVRRVRSGPRGDIPLVLFLWQLDAARVRSLISIGADGFVAGTNVRDQLAGTIAKSCARREALAVQELLRATKLS
jgi:hypothetical protein